MLALCNKIAFSDDFPTITPYSENCILSVCRFATDTVRGRARARADLIVCPIKVIVTVAWCATAHAF